MYKKDLVVLKYILLKLMLCGIKRLESRWLKVVVRLFVTTRSMVVK